VATSLVGTLGSDLSLGLSTKPSAHDSENRKTDSLSSLKLMLFGMEDDSGLQF
jgi:hypothetical protein